MLDPRFDAEPTYWRALRERAGLRADWAWEVLAVRAWSGRTPVLLAVAGGARPWAVVCAEWAGLPVRRNGFVGVGRARVLGGLHVRAPGTGSVPGWWAAEDVPVGELLHDYVRAMRRELGIGCRGALLRQVPQEVLDRLRVSPRLVRPTEAMAVLDLTGLRTHDEWAATLPRKRRQNLRKIIRDLAAADHIAVDVVPGTAVDPVEMASVLVHNERKYNTGRLVPLPQNTGYLAALLRQPDTLVGRYTDRRTGRLLALVSILDHPTWPVMRHWSAVPWPDPGARPNLYLNQYSTVVSWATEGGRQGILVGKGKATLKESLGAELVPQFAAVLR